MSLDIAAEVWDALRSHIDLSERKHATDSLINMLIDNGYEAEDIKEAFHGDKDVLTALKGYLEDHEDSYDEDYEDDDDEEDW